MNAPTVIFASAYRQLGSAERSFVDAAVRQIEDAADRAGERISLALNRPIPVKIVNQSRGLLENALVCAAITERITQIAADRELTSQRLIKELLGIATSNINDFMSFDDEDMPYFDLSKATPEQLATIKSVDVESNADGLSRAGKTKIKIVFHDKLPAIKMLGDHVGMWASDNPYYRAEQAKSSDKSALPADATPEQAADLYAGYLTGGGG